MQEDREEGAGNAEFGLRNGDQEKESRFDRRMVGESGRPYWPNEANLPQDQCGLDDASRSAPFGVGLLLARGRRTELSGRDVGGGASARAKARGSLGLIVCAPAFEVRIKGVSIKGVRNL